MTKNIIVQLEKISKETSNQGKLAEYLLNYNGNISNLKIRMICNDIYVSVATATRLSKRLGLQGFNELKIYLLEETIERKEAKIACKNISIDHYQSDIYQSLEKTLAITSVENIDRISKIIFNTPNIDFYAVGGSNVILKDIAYKLARIKKRISVYSDTHLQYVQAVNSDDTTVSFGLSYSGNTKEVMNMLKIAKKKWVYHNTDDKKY